VIVIADIVFTGVVIVCLSVSEIEGPVSATV